MFPLPRARHYSEQVVQNGDELMLYLGGAKLGFPMIKDLCTGDESKEHREFIDEALERIETILRRARTDPEYADSMCRFPDVNQIPIMPWNLTARGFKKAWRMCTTFRSIVNSDLDCVYRKLEAECLEIEPYYRHIPEDDQLTEDEREVLMYVFIRGVVVEQLYKGPASPESQKRWAKYIKKECTSLGLIKNEEPPSNMEIAIKARREMHMLFAGKAKAMGI